MMTLHLAFELAMYFIYQIYLVRFCQVHINLTRKNKMGAQDFKEVKADVEESLYDTLRLTVDAMDLKKITRTNSLPNALIKNLKLLVFRLTNSIFPLDDPLVEKWNRTIIQDIRKDISRLPDKELQTEVTRFFSNLIQAYQAYLAKRQLKPT